MDICDNKLFYTNGSLSRYLYPVLLTRVTYNDNAAIKILGARWDFDFKKWCVNFDNSYFQSGALDVYHPFRNGEFIIRIIYWFVGLFLTDLDCYTSPDNGEVQLSMEYNW